MGNPAHPKIRIFDLEGPRGAESKNVVRPKLKNQSISESLKLLKATFICFMIHYNLNKCCLKFTYEQLFFTFMKRAVLKMFFF